MNFFEQQQSARSTTRRFAALFALFAIPSFCCFTVVTIVLFGWMFGFGPWDDKDMSSTLLFGGIATAFLCAILVLIKYRQVQRGADYISENIECERVWRATADDPMQRTRNIVEEMSLAAGIPPPRLFVWETFALNSLTVGHGPADAGLFVSRGAVEKLSRDEMQALVAHGVAQIVNGDMALNGRLAGFLFMYAVPLRLAVLLITWPAIVTKPLGETLQKLAGFLLILPFVITALPGAILGVFSAPPYLFGLLLKKLVVRERNGLADACAVQFTRNPSALRDLLAKVQLSGTIPGRLPSPFADLSHAFFVAPVRERGWGVRVYPSIESRIRAIDPAFGAARAEAAKAQSRATAAQESDRPLESQPQDRLAFLGSIAAIVAALPVSSAPKAGRASPPARVPAGAVKTQEAVVPAPPVVAIDEQAGTVAKITTASDPRAVLLALLVDRKPGTQRQQIEGLRQWFGETSIVSVLEALRVLRPFEHTERTLAIDMHLPALRELPAPELKRLMHAIEDIEQKDDSRDVFEYAIARVARVFITDVLHPRVPHGSERLDQRATDLHVLFTVMAQNGARAEAASAYDAGMRAIDPAHRFRFARFDKWTRKLDGTLGRLDALEPMAKELLLDAIAKTLRFDGQETPSERELLRAIAASLHCPVART